MNIHISSGSHLRGTGEVKTDGEGGDGASSDWPQGGNNFPEERTMSEIFLQDSGIRLV